MRTRSLGRTGHSSSIAIAGGIAFHYTSGGEDTEQLLHEFLDAGVNHLDIVPEYQTAEEKVGRYLPVTG